MNKFIPNMYKKSIFDIDYKLLKKKEIKVLLFDFDNTIIEKGNYSIEKNTIDLFKSLKKDFIIYVVSNSLNKKKLSNITSKLDLDFIHFSMKPFSRGYKRLKLNIPSNEIAMIGDQLLTDVYGGNRRNYFTILVEPLNDDEMKFTKFNRKFENMIFNSKKNTLKRGKYYD
ncbi:MAG: YqeG family HAD IIIA-type phosphatase [bacterium]|nr:YqeG family HAD IIIA-type phosphatase [bacterium]